ncbi:aldo/keto reductase [Lacticaseibacillus jixianensis]|uniref:Aldo/keto reductase n=1 Tax=Lacticaseibacillus jixianensis TaxID=2486012 RepID=A0ABW4B6R4_9LACO|nr:aldo/keto reductase [Lacticaseibacillus jixianensis]
MKTTQINQVTVPALGIGTWALGEGPAAQSTAELTAIRAGLDAGLTLIDTAEMYGDGKAETLVGQAIAPYDRSRLYLVSKFYPWHATPKLMRLALEKSLQRLGTDYLDLYLLHWPGETPLTETLSGLVALKKAGLIRAYGLSNFDLPALKAARALPGGKGIAANEVLYNVAARGIDFDLIPYQQQRNLPLLGYSPFGSGNGRQIPLPSAVVQLAHQMHLSVHQLLLAWAGRGPVIPLVKTGSAAHMAANLAALAVQFTAAQLAIIDAAFPAPTRKVPLQSI